MPHRPHCHPTAAYPCNFHSHLQQLSASALRTDRVIAKITTSTASCCCCCYCIPIECMRIAMIFALSSSLTSLRLISSHLISPASMCLDSQVGYPNRSPCWFQLILALWLRLRLCVCFVCFVNVAMSDMVWTCLVPGIQPRLLLFSASFHTRMYERAAFLWAWPGNRP